MEINKGIKTLKSVLSLSVEEDYHMTENEFLEVTVSWDMFKNTKN